MDTERDKRINPWFAMVARYGQAQASAALSGALLAEIVRMASPEDRRDISARVRETAERDIRSLAAERATEFPLDERHDAKREMEAAGLDFLSEAFTSFHGSPIVDL